IQFSTLNGADFIHGVTQNRFLCMAGGGDASSGAICRFLKQMACVSARPFPVNFVRGGRLVQSFPPREIGFAAKASVHRLYNIPRISKNAHLARLEQRFESNGGSGDLSLLVRRNTQILSDG